MRSSRVHPRLHAIRLSAAAILAFGACGEGGPSEPNTDGPTQLLVQVVGSQNAGATFDVSVTLADAQGSPINADAASEIALTVDAGAGSLTGTISGSLAAGASQVTLEDAIYDHAESGIQLRATGTSGTASGLSGVSQPFTLNFDNSPALIAFRRTINDREDIYLMEAGGSAYMNLSDNESVDSDPAWSPDGSRIAFGSTRSGNADLWVMNVDGTGLTQVTNNEGSVRFPSWSPDGSIIAYSANVNDQRDLYVVESPPASSIVADFTVASAVPTQVTDDPGTDNEPVFTPDGGQILFFSNRDGPGAIWSIDFNAGTGSNPVKLTLDFVFACAPGSGWSLVDGRVKMSFVGETDGQLDIWTMDFDGSNKMKVTENQADEFYSSYTNESPSSLAIRGANSLAAQELGRLVYDSDRDGRWQLYTINEDGTGEARLTDHPGDDQMPRWRPAAN
ncbi:MAG: TolB family protein [Longimicrobiales bacterium]